MDPFFIGVIVYGSIQTIIFSEPNGGGAVFPAVVAALILWAFAAYLVWRPVRYVFIIGETAVDFKEYRCFGYVLKRHEVFQHSDLGCLVFDTERRCCGLRGFVGVYMTYGIPTPGAPLKVAFQIPIIYNGWSMNAMRHIMVQSHLNTFNALQRALGFYPMKAVSIDVTTTRNWEYVDGNMELVQKMEDNLFDSLASYDEFVSINRAIYPPKFRLEKEIQGGRAVYLMTA